MKGVVLSGAYEVEVRDEPYPKILEDGDVILRVHLAGLCGSDLHYYRAHGGVASPFIMGHEAVGDVVEVGSGVKRFKVGDLVVSSFSLSCGSCFYCKKGYTARCVSAVCMGNPTYPGCQAEFVRVAMADSSMFPLPSDLPKELGLMLADILPTGFSVAYNAKRLADEERELLSQQGGSKEGVVVVIGCGPVGLCAISAAKTLFSQVFATDLQASRLPAAEKHGATALPLDQLMPAVLEATGGRGADAVLELVGHESALVTALDLVRPYGVVSVGGMHGRPVTIDGALLYNKNIRMQFGRCSVQSFFPKALALLRDNQELFSSFIENYIELDEAPKYYKLFEQNKVAKTAFVGYKPE